MPARHCTILGGPNGSGKSTIAGLLKPSGTFVNADVVARRLNPAEPERASLSAGRRILAQLDTLKCAGESFVYETTLSSHQAISLMRECRELGYEVGLVFVVLDNPDLNVRRVAERVNRGGHDIPEPVIRRRCEASLRRLPDAVALADTCLVFDNSRISPDLIMVVEHGGVTRDSLDPARDVHRRIAAAVAAGLKRFGSRSSLPA